MMWWCCGLRQLCLCLRLSVTQSIVAHVIHRLHPGPLLPTVECRIECRIGAALALSGIIPVQPPDPQDTSCILVSRHPSSIHKYFVGVKSVVTTSPHHRCPIDATSFLSKLWMSTSLSLALLEQGSLSSASTCTPRQSQHESFSVASQRLQGRYWNKGRP